MRKIEFNFIEFVFENCETLKMLRDDIGAISLDEVVENYCMHYNGERSINFYKVSNNVMIKIKPQADKSYNPFGVSDFHSTIFKRFEQGDITSIVLLDSNNKEVDEFYVPFDGEEVNLNQSTRFDDNGYFEICICEGNGKA